MEFSQKPNSIKQPDRNYNNHLPNTLHSVGGGSMNTSTLKPPIYRDAGISKSHWEEWVNGSGIAPEITLLNLKTLTGEEPWEALLYSDKLQRTNTGRLSFSIINRYKFLDFGGWWCGSIGTPWGCFKPNQPKFDENKNKYQKYVHPEKESTGLFLLAIPIGTWQRISQRYKVDLPKNYQEVKSQPEIFWDWVTQHPQIPIMLSEGCKKAAAILSQGFVAISAPGINSFARTPKDEFGEPCGEAQLIPEMMQFCSKGRLFYACFDQDTKPTTVQAVNRALTKLSFLLKAQGCEIKITTWSAQRGKGIDDVLAKISAEQREEVFSDLYRKSRKFEEWRTRQAKRLTHAPSKIINQKYIENPDDPNSWIEIPANAQLIVIKSPKGSGKSTLFKRLTEPAMLCGESRTLLVTHRIQLSVGTANKIGLPYITETKSSDVGTLFGMAICIDSLRPNGQARIKPEDWSQATILLDEIMQVIWHLLNSSTCRHDRVLIIKTLQELLRHVIKTGGRIVVADADLSDLAIDFIQGLVGQSLEKFILVNEYKATEKPWNCFIFGGKNPASLISELERQLSEEKRIYLATSAQKTKSKWGTQTLEKHFKKLFPHLKILRIDSQTVGDKNHPAYCCTSDINYSILDYDLIIASPTLETGISIETWFEPWESPEKAINNHFDAVFAIEQGVSTCDGFRQKIHRVREGCDRYLWIAKRGLSNVGNASTSDTALIKSQQKVDVANIKILAQADISISIEDRVPNICLKTWGRIGALINLGNYNYHDTICTDIQEEGHKIIKWENKHVKDSRPTEEVEKEITKTQKENYLKYRQDVESSGKLTPVEKEKLERQNAKTYEESLQLRKAQIEDKYSVDCTAELVEKDDDRWYPKINLYYYWKDGRQYLQPKDKRTAQAALKNGENRYFLVDTNRSLLGLKVALIDFLGIEELYLESEYHNEHPTVIKVFNKIKKHVREIKDILGVNLRKLINDETQRIRAIKEILKVLGLTMVNHRRETTGERRRYYSQPASDFHRVNSPEERKSNKCRWVLDANKLPIPLDDGRSQIYEQWLERDQKLLEKEARAEKYAQESATIAPYLNSIKEISKDFAQCQEEEEFQLLAGCYPLEVIKFAIKDLSRLASERINNWLKNLILTPVYT